MDRRNFVQRVLMAMGASTTATPKLLSATPAAEKTNAGYIRPNTIEVIERSFDVIVVGGGISGTCAAISAARNGAKTALVHERSTLGGNSSSEVRLYPEDTCGFSPWIKESGVLEEIATEERARNWEPYIEGLMNSNWDLVLYEWAKREKNLSLFLNTTMREVVMKDAAHIAAIHAPQLGTEREFILSAQYFIDASGDGVLGYRAGADFRWGKELRSEYNEALAPPEPTEGLMGNTLFFRARDTGHPVTFKRPDWAAEFDTEEDLTNRDHGNFETGYWWIEVGAPMHPIKDNEEIRDEALRQLLGVWDHIKNHCTHGEVRERAKNFALEFVGFWPYKRESRRILGDYVLTEKDVRNPAVHPDDIAYGAWGIDIHVPGGIERRNIPPYPEPRSDENFQHRSTIPYGIPLRSCYSRNVHNLLMAGRPISASYVAFASSRVLTTGASVGQGVGAAAALCCRNQCDPKLIATKYADQLQQLLLRQDASIPGIENHDEEDLARRANVSSSGESTLLFPESDTFHPARLALGQIFPVSGKQLDSVELLLQSTSSTPQTLTIRLRKVQHVWDMRSSPQIASATATVPAGHRGYVTFPLNTQTMPDSLYFLTLDAAPEISWAMFNDVSGQTSRVPVGSTAADLAPGNIWRPFTHGHSFCLRVHPEQKPYGAENIVRGTNRPDLWTNIYVSGTIQNSPAWVELKFPSPVSFNQVQLTFDTDTSRRISLPLFHYPECVKHYEVAVPDAGGWKTLVRVEDNYFRHRMHQLDSIQSDRIRINLLETNGSPEARLYEVRVYNTSAKT
jgi:hypothetical protein